MKTRSLRRILTAVLMTTFPMTGAGCSEIVSTTDAGAPDSAGDAPIILADAGVDVTPELGADVPTDRGADVPTDRGADVPADVPVDVPVDVPADVPADAPVDVPPDRFCGMCGCDFTGRLEGRGPVGSEHCVGAPDDAGAADGGGVDSATCEIDCNSACQRVTVSGSGFSRPWAGGGPGIGGPGSCERASATEVICLVFVPCGRRTDGQRELHLGGAVSDYLVRSAFLEAQSVGAFERMALELRAHGAPAGLVRGAERSAREERAHAAAMEALCEARGLTPVPVEDGPTDVRALDAVALENAVEGCTRETWGALLAMHQGAHAQDQDVRLAMTSIARDEVRHAALSWALHRWALASLDAPGRAAVALAVERAWDTLEATLAVDPPAALASPLGLPDAPTALALARSLRARLAA